MKLSRIVLWLSLGVSACGPAQNSDHHPQIIGQPDSNKPSSDTPSKPTDKPDTPTDKPPPVNQPTDPVDPKDPVDNGNGNGDPTPDPTEGTPAGVELNAHWLGGACASVADCSTAGYSQPAQCLTNGFDNGLCTQACKQSSGSWICPDTNTGTGSGNTLTRCINASGDPRCVSECDFSQSPTGCRPGYACVKRQRYGQPDKIFPVCLPEDSQVWPGETSKPVDIGKACTKAQDCASLACLDFSGGYCSKTYCESAGCPTGSTCAKIGNEQSFCVKNCGNDSECRQNEGYSCDDKGLCWTEAPKGNWDSSVGSADCAAVWGNAGEKLHTCDTTKDNYVVVHKSKRNLALCNKGALVKNFRIGLGFAPVDDKEKEGDGKTPEGVFYASMRLPNSSYYNAYLISYPDKADAVRGLSAGLITTAQKNAIDAAQNACGNPPQKTGLGGEIELHGKGGSSDWTLGCVAADNAAIDEIWATIGARDTIAILP